MGLDGWAPWASEKRTWDVQAVGGAGIGGAGIGGAAGADANAGSGTYSAATGVAGGWASASWSRRMRTIRATTMKATRTTMPLGRERPMKASPPPVVLIIGVTRDSSDISGTATRKSWECSDARLGKRRSAGAWAPPAQR